MDKRRKGVDLSKTVVDSLSAPPERYVWDLDTKGLGLRLRASGSKWWVYRYRFRGRQRYADIGEHGQPWTVKTARDRARELQGEVARGADPAAERERRSAIPTLEKAAEKWIAEEAVPYKAPASVAQDKLMLARIKVAYVDRERGEVEDLGRTRVDAVTSAQVAKLHVTMQGTPIQANRAVALLSTIFSWTGRSGDNNPCHGIRRYEENKRERFLSMHEFGRLGATLTLVEDLWRQEADGGESPLMVGAIRLLIFTGARPGELLTARRAWVDTKARTLRILKPKEKTPKLLRLGKPAMEVLKTLPIYAGNPYLLPGHKRGAHLVNLHDAWERIRTRAQLSGVRLYDLRHSYASLLAGGMRESLPVIGALLGHKRVQTTARYVHFAEDPLRGVADAAAVALDNALNMKPRRSAAGRR